MRIRVILYPEIKRQTGEALGADMADSKLTSQLNPDLFSMAWSPKGMLAVLTTWINAFFQRVIVFALLAGPIPNHVAFIMDGNRRFARRNNEPVTKGHDQGSQALRNVCLVSMLAGLVGLTWLPR
jgi:hypothetical protein